MSKPEKGEPMPVRFSGKGWQLVETGDVLSVRRKNDGFMRLANEVEVALYVALQACEVMVAEVAR
jgi:hypothetical protein